MQALLDHVETNGLKIIGLNGIKYYLENIKEQNVTLPVTKTFNYPDYKVPDNVWHVFAIRHPHRDRLQEYLAHEGIQTLIHYPIPPHRQQAYSELSYLSLPVTEQIHNEILSLPINQVLIDSELAKVVEAINKFQDTY